MFVDWTKHLPEQQDKIDFEKRLRYNHKEVLNRILQILDEDERSLNRSEVDPKAYEVANWSNLQAHKNGYRAHLNRMKKLIESVDNQILLDQKG
jgi:hypothetical protein